MFFTQFYDVCLSFFVTFLSLWQPVYQVLTSTVQFPEFDPVILNILPFLEGLSGYSCSAFTAFFGSGILFYFGFRLVKFFWDAIPGL